MSARVRSSVAGATAAAVWALQEPLDQRVFRSDYSDVAILGRAAMPGRGWRPVGLAAHVANGALFGLAYHEARRLLPARPQRLALAMALGEHLVLYPLGYFVDNYHPCRGTRGIPPLLRNRRAFGQATWRHLVFGTVLGRLAG